MRRFSSLVIVAVVFALAWAPAGGRQTHRYQEQWSFSAEDEGVRHPVPLPAEVLAILQKDDMVHSEAEYDKIALDQLPPSWFSASEIHLGSPREVDLVVEAQGELRGANVIMFWTFVRKGDNYSLALAIPAHNLIVKNSRSYGFRDIEAMSATAVTVTTAIFRFDGNEYTEHSERTEAIK